MTDDLKDSVLSIFEASLDAQLRAVRRLRQGDTAPAPRPRKGQSQVDMAYDVLKKARSPLHVSELLARIHSSFGVAVDRTLLVGSVHLAQSGADFTHRRVGFHRIDDERHGVHGRNLAVLSCRRLLRSE